MDASSHTTGNVFLRSMSADYSLVFYMSAPFSSSPPWVKPLWYLCACLCAGAFVVKCFYLYSCPDVDMVFHIHLHGLSNVCSTKVLVVPDLPALPCSMSTSHMLHWTH